MTASERRNRFAAAGRCAVCGKRVVRGFADDGALVVVGIYPTSSVDEHLHRARGGESYVLGWARMGMTLRRRTEGDILLRPAGTANERVVLAHDCEREVNAHE